VGLVPTLRHIDALLGTCWRWDDDDDDPSAAHATASELPSPIDDLADLGD
jgi:hypothetical protein